MIPSRSRAGLDRGVRSIVTDARTRSSLWLLGQRRGPGMYSRSEVRAKTVRIGDRRLQLIEQRLTGGTPDSDGVIPLQRARIWVVDPAEPGFPLAELHYPDPASTVGRPLVWCIDRVAASEAPCPAQLPDDVRRVPLVCRPTESRWITVRAGTDGPELETRSYTCARRRGRGFEIERMRTVTSLRGSWGAAAR